MSRYTSYGEYSQGLGISPSKDGSLVIGKRSYDSKLDGAFSRVGTSSVRPPENQ